MSRLSVRSVVAPAALVLVVGLASSLSYGQVDTSWQNTAGGLWSQSANWDNGVPNGSFNAFINIPGEPVGTPYVITLDMNFAVVGFQMNSTDAVLDLTSNALTVNGDYTMQGSLLRGTPAGSGQVLTSTASNVTIRDARMQDVSNFLSLGTLTFDAAGGGSTITRSTITHTGTAAAWTGAADLIFGDSASFNNGAASTFSISNNQSLVWDNTGTRPIFTNAGVVAKTAGAGLTFVDGVAFNNTGTLDVSSGTFRANQVANLSAGTLTGGMFVVNNATLDFVGGSITTNSSNVVLNGASSVFAAINPLATNTVSGTFSIRGGRAFTTAGSFANTGTLEVGSGSTFTVGPGSTLFDDGGFITSPDLGPGGVVNLLGGSTLRNTVLNRVTVHTQGNLAIDGNMLLDACDTDIDHSGSGAVNWSGGGDIQLDGSASFTLGSGSTMNIANNQMVRSDNLPGNFPVFTNNGSVTKNSGAGTTTFDNVRFNNAGSMAVPGLLKVLSGTLSLESVQNVSSGTLAGGKWIVDGASSVLDFSTQTISVNQADVKLRNGVAATQFPALQSTLASNAAAGVLTLEAGASFTTAGNFQNLGLITIDGTEGASSFVVAPGSTLTNYNPSNKKITGGKIVVVGQGRAGASFEADGLDIEVVDADIQLFGNGAGIQNATSSTLPDALTNLRLIDDAGALTISEGKNFSTTGDFAVAQTGRLTVGVESEFEVPAGADAHLLNYNPADASFNNGEFIVAGRLIAPDFAVHIVNNTVVMDGPGNGRFFSRGGDGTLTNAFATLERIGSPGAEAGFILSGGQELDLLPGLDHNLLLSAGSTLRLGAPESPGGRLHVAALPGAPSSGNFMQDGVLFIVGAPSADDGLQVDGDWTQASTAFTDLLAGRITVGGALNQNGVFHHGGVLSVGGDITVHGLFSGTGQVNTLNGDFILDGGVISPGASPGLLSLGGAADFRFRAGTLVMEIFGTTPGVEYDQLTLAHSLLFESDGEKVVNVVLGNFTPRLGDTFDLIVSEDGFVGDFTQINLPTLGNGLAFERVMDSSALRLVVVPGPSSVFTLGGMGMLGLAARRRRRR